MTTYVTGVLGIILLVLSVLLAAGAIPFTPLVVGAMLLGLSLGLLVPMVTVVRP